LIKAPAGAFFTLKRATLQTPDNKKAPIGRFGGHQSSVLDGEFGERTNPSYLLASPRAGCCRRPLPL